MWPLSLLLACGPLPEAPGPQSARADAPISVAQAWRSGAGQVWLHALVASPRSLDGTTFYIADPEGGPEHGMLVAMQGQLYPWPPPLGTPVSLRGELLTGKPPTLKLARAADLSPLGEPQDLGSVAYDPEQSQIGALVWAEGVAVSNPDPTGQVQTSLGLWLDARFGEPLPTQTTPFDVPGILVEAGRLAVLPGGEYGAPTEEPWPLTQLPHVFDLPLGACFRSAGLQITPWSRDGRYAVVQDTDGRGLWLDAEGYGAPDSERGELVSFNGVRDADPSGPLARVWDPVTVRFGGAPTLTDGTRSGDLITLDLPALPEPDAEGLRHIGDYTLDERFALATELQYPATVQAVIRRGPGGPFACILPAN